MENLTLGDFAGTITMIVGLITGFGFLKKNLKKWVASALDEQLKALTNDIKCLNERLDTVDMEGCKNFLVARISELEKDMTLNEIQRERFWEEYEHYQKIGGNSYITRKVEQLKEDGKI